MTRTSVSSESHDHGRLKSFAGFLKTFAGFLRRNYKSAYGWLLFLVGPFLLLLSLRSTAGLDEADPTQMAFFLWIGLIELLVFAVFTRRLAKEPEKEHVGTVVVLAYLGISATAMLLYGLGQLAAVVGRNDTQITVRPAQSQLHMGDLYQKFLFDALDVVPVLEIPKTLGWDDPIPDPAAPLGIMLIFTKFVVVVIVIATAVRLLRAAPNTRFRRNRGQGQAVSERPAENTAPANGSSGLESGEVRPGSDQPASQRPAEAAPPAPA